MNQNRNTNNKHTFRPLEELNLIDNFLFQQLLSSEDGEEFARILLSTILEKPIRRVKIVSQKSILGVDPNRHGIRLDAYIEDISDADNPGIADAELLDARPLSDLYDIEPNRNYEKETLPKRMRYYHGLIDTQLLSAGSGYGKLPNVVIIFILPYDPFDKNRMVYTIQNRCTEDVSIPYNDGATKIVLYTKGAEGNPSQSLKDMLKYIQESTENNVTNQDIASIQQFVNKVKRKKEVGINYMISWDVEREAREEGLKEGRIEGRIEGRSDGAEMMSQLIIRLTEAGRMEDITKAARDAEYREQLFQEFDLYSHIVDE